jgi:hypothetical protein
MDKYQITLTGKTPLLLHHDDIDWADAMDAWKNDPSNKVGSKAGDDRSPAHRWIGCLYHDGAQLCIPQDNVMRSIMEGGAMVPVPGGKSGKTFKSQTQSGIASPDAYWSLAVAGKSLPYAPVKKLIKEPDFAAHKKAALDMGFSLFVKRAKVGTSKHIRVRPRFDGWSLSGVLLVTDKQITANVLTDILTYAGQYKGLGDWRPGGKTPGPYGMFDAVVKKFT